jgi:transposase-like protein
MTIQGMCPHCNIRMRVKTDNYDDGDTYSYYVCDECGADYS